MGRMTMTVVDFDGDKPQFSVPTANAADDGTDYTTWFADMEALRTNTEAILRCPTDVYSYAAKRVDNNAAPPINPDAQATDQWIVEFSVDGMSGGPYSVRIPGADRALGISRNGRVELDISTGVGAAFVTAFQAAYVFPGQLDTAGTGAATVQVIYVART